MLLVRLLCSFNRLLRRAPLPKIFIDFHEVVVLLLVVVVVVAMVGVLSLQRIFGALGILKVLLISIVILIQFVLSGAWLHISAVPGKFESHSVDALLVIES